MEKYEHRIRLRDQFTEGEKVPWNDGAGKIDIKYVLWLEDKVDVLMDTPHIDTIYKARKKETLNTLKYKINEFIDRGPIDMDHPTYYKGLIAMTSYYNELKESD